VSASHQIAIVGATGYVGGLLTEALIQADESPVCVSRRRPKRLSERAKWRHGDVMDRESLASALKGIDVAYYLVHALGDPGNFAELEQQGANNFTIAAEAAGVRRIIYLGALAQEEGGLSPHIASRHAVGEILRSSTVPTIEFRASIILGAGSMPFEAIRVLVERLPMMVTPRWVRNPVQPIAARDLANYLLAAAEEESTENHIYEIGGSDQVTYRDLLAGYAKARGLRRVMIPVPLITPRLSSLWLRLITPATYRIGRRIVASALHDSVVASDRAERRFKIRPMSASVAISTALADERDRLRQSGSASDGISNDLATRLRAG